MGNIQQTQHVFGQEEQLSWFRDGQFIEKLDNEAYGECKILQSKKTKILWVLSTRSFSRQKEMEAFIQICEGKMQLEHDNLLKFYNYLIMSESEYCSQFTKVHLAFEYLSSTLYKEMILKKQKHIQFSEREITNMIAQVVSALIYLYQSGITHEYISPQTILAENGLYKIPDSQFMISETGYSKCLMGSTEYCYLSPKLLQGLMHRDKSPIHDIEKSDAFSLGLTALQMCILQPLNEIYDFDLFEIKNKELFSKIAILKGLYSQELSSLIEAMLVLDESKRPGFQEILSSVQNLAQQNNSRLKSWAHFSFNEAEMKKLQSNINKQSQMQSGMKTIGGNLSAKKQELITMSHQPANKQRDVEKRYLSTQTSTPNIIKRNDSLTKKKKIFDPYNSNTDLKTMPIKDDPFIQFQKHASQATIDIYNQQHQDQQQTQQQILLQNDKRISDFDEKLKSYQNYNIKEPGKIQYDNLKVVEEDPKLKERLTYDKSQNCRTEIGDQDQNMEFQTTAKNWKVYFHNPSSPQMDYQNFYTNASNNDKFRYASKHSYSNKSAHNCQLSKKKSKGQESFTNNRIDRSFNLQKIKIGDKDLGNNFLNKQPDNEVTEFITDEESLEVVKQCDLLGYDENIYDLDGIRLEKAQKQKQMSVFDTTLEQLEQKIHQYEQKAQFPQSFGITKEKAENNQINNDPYSNNKTNPSDNNKITEYNTININYNNAEIPNCNPFQGADNVQNEKLNQNNNKQIQQREEEESKFEKEFDTNRANNLHEILSPKINPSLPTFVQSKVSKVPELEIKIQQPNQEQNFFQDKNDNQNVPGNLLQQQILSPIAIVDQDKSLSKNESLLYEFNNMQQQQQVQKQGQKNTQKTLIQIQLSNDLQDQNQSPLVQDRAQQSIDSKYNFGKPSTSALLNSKIQSKLTVKNNTSTTPTNQQQKQVEGQQITLEQNKIRSLVDSNDKSQKLQKSHTTNYLLKQSFKGQQLLQQQQQQQQVGSKVNSINSQKVSFSALRYQVGQTKLTKPKNLEKSPTKKIFDKAVSQQC